MTLKKLLILFIIFILMLGVVIANPPPPPPAPDTNPDGSSWDDSVDDSDDGSVDDSSQIPSSLGENPNPASSVSEETNQTLTDNTSIVNETNKESEQELIRIDTPLQDIVEETEEPKKHQSPLLFIVVGLAMLIFISMIVISTKKIRKNQESIHSNKKKSSYTNSSEQKALEYINLMRKSYSSDEVIRNNLINVGWDREFVDDLLKRKN